MIEEKQVIQSLRKVLDPELMINIIDLGLVYDIRLGEGIIEVDYTLTYPGCPLAPEIERNIIKTLKEDLEVEKVRTFTVWSPPWNPVRMSEEARFAMGYPV
ncbi:MAG: metal-sulfur cluster assembly factor [Spirochaetales bacterium]|nr:metal-sulfur cluster assembly factor [Spirochaetales bacterium]